MSRPGQHRRPPKWADRLLEFYCKDSILEDLQGDLHEYFYRNLADKGYRKAAGIYVLDVLKFIRPYTIRKTRPGKYLSISIMMYRNYLKTSFRNLTNSSVFSLINIIGLAVSMSVGLLIITMITELLSYDDFHKDQDRLYRVNNTYVTEEGTDGYATTSILAYRRIAEEVDGIENIVGIRKSFRRDFELGDKVIPLQGHYVSQDFFNVFSFNLLQGNPETALTELYSIVLTEESAKKLFGDEPALGKTVSSDTLEYLVTGIVEDPPRNSHIDFEVLGSFSTIDEANKEHPYWMNWRNMWMNLVYFKVEEGVDKSAIQAAFDRIADEENEKMEDHYGNIYLGIQNFSNIIPGKDLYNQIGKTAELEMVWTFASLALVILISACFNYTNLSIARSLKRSREVGVRKVIGASSNQVFSQFVLESIVISLIALVLAYGLFLFLSPHFRGLNEQLNELLTMEPSGMTYLYFVVFAVFVGVLAGLIPGLFFSRLNPQAVLKAVLNRPAVKGLTLGRALIFVQFTFSIGLVLITILIYNQYTYALNFDLGYNTENILNIELQENDEEILINEFERLSEVQGVSTSLMITSIGNYYGATSKYKSQDDSTDIWYNSIDHRYLDLHGHSLAYGSNFKDVGENPNPRPVIVNDLLIETMGLPEGIDAIGELLTVEDDTAVVVGVLGDFHYGTVQAEMKPFLFVYEPEEAYYLNVKVMSNDMISTLERLESVWKGVDQTHPFTATFYDEQIQQAYSEYSTMVKLIGFISTASILIAFMGLLGMLVFTTETRMKEISVRKVLGATLQNLMFVIGKTYFVLLCAAIVVSLPATYLIFDYMILDDVVFKAEITVVEFLYGVLLVVGLALAAIIAQTIHAARTNPADILRNE